MKKALGTALLLFSLGCQQAGQKDVGKVIEARDNPGEYWKFEFDRTKDPKTGTLPQDWYYTLMQNAIAARQSAKQNSANNTANALVWQERGPYIDQSASRTLQMSTGGRIRAIWADLADPTGKTIFTGSVSGGLWKCNDITAQTPGWTVVNDQMSNLAIASICQDPSNTNIFYCSTGESYGNSDATSGAGIFKSIDHGVTWTRLASSGNFYMGRRILCDAVGNVYVVDGYNGIARSIDGGNSWVNITPTGVSAIFGLEFSDPSGTGSGTGRLHISAAGGITRYTDNPATVTATSGWVAPTTPIPLPATLAGSSRCEIAVGGNTVYAYTYTYVYKSADGGDTWAFTAGQPRSISGFGYSQDWYDIAIGVNPTNANECAFGNLNGYRTVDGGTNWVLASTQGSGTNGQYVHADQHRKLWYDNGNKLITACDGGLFYSSDKGVNNYSRNDGLRVKQFYSCSIHPTLANYFLAGAQDNGTHRYSQPGLGATYEVSGGDGIYNAIDEEEPQYQYLNLQYNSFLRSIDGGVNFSYISNMPAGGFYTRFVLDALNKVIYFQGGAAQYSRFNNCNSGNTTVTETVPLAGSAGFSAIKPSPYTMNRVYFGTSNGKIIRVDNAHTSSHTDTDISPPGMTGSISSISLGRNDQYLMATSTSYGVGHVWTSTNGGTTWVNQNASLSPSVYCGIFYPGDESRAIVATSTGIWESSLLNGNATVWTPATDFPIVRTTWLAYRPGDRTLIASTYGRGVWSTTIPPATTQPQIQFEKETMQKAEQSATASGCRTFKDYVVYMQIANPPSGDANITLSLSPLSTATPGSDFDYTTNGNFSSPSHTLVFAAGSTASQPVTLRVYDDNGVEGPEFFTLQYAISGSGNAVAGSMYQTLTFNITDNDVLPTPASGIAAYTIGSASIQVNPAILDARLINQRVYLMYRASELSAAGASAGPLSKISINIQQKNSTRPYENFNVRVSRVSPSFTYLYPNGINNLTNTQVVAQLPSFVPQLGWNDIAFDVAYNWNGTDNLVFELCYTNATTASTQGVDYAWGYSDGGLGQTNLVTSVSACGTQLGSYGASTPGKKPQVVLTFGSGNEVATSLSATSNNIPLGPYQEGYFFLGSASTGKIFARIKNLTGFDYGCTQVTIDRSGTNALPFWSNTPQDYVAAKSFKILPTNNTPNGNYEISLYYTGDEVSGWEAATGNSTSGIKMVKVSGGYYIPDVTPATPYASNVVIVPATVESFGSGYCFTGSFSNTSFSGFSIGNPGASALPVGFISFTARAAEKHALLDWTVAGDDGDNLGYVVEKSADGNAFKKIGFVGAVPGGTRYSFLDSALLQYLQFYRLRQVSKDGKETLSNIVPVRTAPGQVLNFSVATNPFENFIEIGFASPIGQNTRYALYDAGGRLVQSGWVHTGSVHARVPVPATLQKGAYLLRVGNEAKMLLKR